MTRGVGDCACVAPAQHEHICGVRPWRLEQGTLPAAKRPYASRPLPISSSCSWFAHTAILLKH